MARRTTENSSTRPTELAGMTIAKASSPSGDDCWFSSSNPPPFTPGLVVGSVLVLGNTGVGLGVALMRAVELYVKLGLGVEPCADSVSENTL